MSETYIPVLYLMPSDAEHVPKQCIASAKDFKCSNALSKEKRAQAKASLRVLDEQLAPERRAPYIRDLVTSCLCQSQHRDKAELVLKYWTWQFRAFQDTVITSTTDDGSDASVAAPEGPRMDIVAQQRLQQLLVRHQGMFMQILAKASDKSKALSIEDEMIKQIAQAEDKREEEEEARKHAIAEAAIKHTVHAEEQRRKWEEEAKRQAMLETVLQRMWKTIWRFLGWGPARAE